MAGAISTTTLPPLRFGDLEGRGYTLAKLIVGGEPMLVAVADTLEERARGLMDVSDLGDLDGMLFHWEGETVEAQFTMRNTLIDLDIAFFDDQGVLVDRLRMEPCTTEECPSYSATGPYAYALEAPAGALGHLGPGDLLTIERMD